MNAKKIAALSMLTAAALILHVFEMRLPDLTAIPGIRMGLANIVTVIAVYRYPAKEAGLVLLARVLLAGIFGGNPSALLYSVIGAVFCFAGMLLLRRAIPAKYLPLCSVFGAVLHNTGQTAAALLVTRSAAVLAYYPVLVAAGCIAGFFTGICAHFVLKRLPTPL